MAGERSTRSSPRLSILRNELKVRAKTRSSPKARDGVSVKPPRMPIHANVHEHISRTAPSPIDTRPLSEKSRDFGAIRQRTLKISKLEAEIAQLGILEKELEQRLVALRGTILSQGDITETVLCEPVEAQGSYYSPLLPAGHMSYDHCLSFEGRRKKVPPTPSEEETRRMAALLKSAADSLLKGRYISPFALPDVGVPSIVEQQTKLNVEYCIVRLSELTEKIQFFESNCKFGGHRQQGGGGPVPHLSAGAQPLQSSNELHENVRELKHRQFKANVQTRLMQEVAEVPCTQKESGMLWKIKELNGKIRRLERRVDSALSQHPVGPQDTLLETDPILQPVKQLEAEMTEKFREIYKNLSGIGVLQSSMESRLGKNILDLGHVTADVKVVKNRVSKLGDSLLDKDELITNLRVSILNLDLRRKLGWRLRTGNTTPSNDIFTTMVRGNPIPSSFRAFLGFIRGIEKSLPGRFQIFPSSFDLYNGHIDNTTFFTVRFSNVATFCASLAMAESDAKKIVIYYHKNTDSSVLAVSGTYTEVDKAGVLNIGAAVGAVRLKHNALLFTTDIGKFEGDCDRSFRLYDPQIPIDTTLDAVIEKYVCLPENSDYAFEITWRADSQRKSKEYGHTGSLIAMYPATFIRSTILIESIADSLSKTDFIEDRVLRTYF